MRIHAIAAVLISLALPLLSQPQNTPTSKQTVQAVKHLTVEDVLAMAEAGVSDGVIIARLRKDAHPFDLSSDELIRLKKAKVSDAVLQTMMDPAATPKEPAPVVVAPLSPLARFAAPNRSGATPSPGVNEAGDQNDPLAPHDSGIYLYTKDRDGKPQMIVLERAGYQGAKTDGMFTSAVTYGIVKAKTKAIIPGPHAGIRVSDPSPVFYFYFDDKQAGLGKSYFGVSNLSNPNQFALLRLEINKSNRETKIGQFGAFGRSSGSDTHAMVPFKSERIRPGLYKVAVEDMKAGEYCFLASTGTAGVGMAAAYGIGVAGSADIFDFGVGLE